MLRSRLALRGIHSGVPRRAERPPTFTTPAPAAVAHSPGDAPLAPLPPTNLPVEDYASPLLHTASFFSRLFRYSVYGSVGIVSLALTSLVTVHLYVEHSALQAPPHDERDDDGWLDDDGGWSGERGGTDPRLGLVARAAVRGAWISINWASGQVASPLAATAPAPASHFGVVGGPRRIGQDAAAATRGQPVPDSGWLMAEQYLVFALREAERRGISLVEPADWERQVELGGVDRAAVALEARLAGLRERIGGRTRLEQARDAWERIYRALAASPTTDLSTAQTRALAEWEHRERVVASRKLGELGQRIAELWGTDSDEGRFEAARAKTWFVEGIAPVLGAAQRTAAAAGGRTTAALVEMPEQQRQEKHVSPRSSFFSFWSRPHPRSSSTLTSTDKKAAAVGRTSDDDELSRLVDLVSTTSPTSLPPATARAVLSSLVSLETFLARTASDLGAAQKVQSTALEFAHRLASSTSTSSRAVAPTTVAQASRRLSALFLATRISALETHLAECTLAARRASSSWSKTKTKTNRRERATALSALHAARDGARSVLVEVPAAAAAAAASVSWSEQVVGLGTKARGVLDDHSRRIRRDAAKVDAIATGLIDFLEAE
ncbi:hypothetical protein JCM11491_004967 [Sporobolomyces phaffii]